MNPRQALDILDKAISEMEVSRARHYTLQQCHGIIMQALAERETLLQQAKSVVTKKSNDG